MVNHQNNITLIFNNIIQIVEYLIKYDKEQYEENKQQWASNLKNIFIGNHKMYHCTIKKIINFRTNLEHTKNKIMNVLENQENSITHVNYIQSSILDVAFSGKLVN